MQTFLPYASFLKSARCLDERRLNKQCLEAAQLVGIADKLAQGVTPKGYSNHPAFLMWLGYEASLVEYAIAVHREFQRRRGKTHLSLLTIQASCYYHTQQARLPPWVGDNRVHGNHRARLLMKGALDVVGLRCKEAERRGISLELDRPLRYLRNYSLQNLANATEQLNLHGIPNRTNYYKQFGWTERMTPENYWPIHE